MSTLDPQLEPPGDWQSPYTPPPGGAGGPTDEARRGAGYVWICAGLSLAMSCCCVLSALGMSMLPRDEIMRQLPADLPNRDQFEQMLPMLAALMGAVGVLVLLIPAVVLGVLGFKVRSGGRGAVVASMVILGLQGAALALVILINLVGVLVNRSIGDLIGVILMAAILAVYIKALAALWAALNPRSDSGMPPVGPWGA